jgi:bifunctional UDP-N-acetylglucosamine pyrophosphorylase/glucosamine-1-phosphate N-acetyltransferase
VEDLSRFGQVIVEDKVKIVEKPGTIPGLANTGLLVLDKEVFKLGISKSSRGEFEVIDYVTGLSDTGKKIDVEEVRDYWLPITYPWNILDATEKLIIGLKGDVHGDIEKGATLKGKVIVGKKTVVRAGSYIEGPVMIGEECQIGPNCFIRPGTVIGNRCRIGNAVEIKNSTIYDGTNISHLSYVGDSVIGENVNLAAGTIVANLRHDHNTIWSPIKGDMVDTGRKKLGAIIADGVHTGINTSIYPGRKIWPGKTTVPGEIVSRDIGDM